MNEDVERALRRASRLLVLLDKIDKDGVFDSLAYRTILDSERRLLTSSLVTVGHDPADNERRYHEMHAEVKRSHPELLNSLKATVEEVVPACGARLGHVRVRDEEGDLHVLVTGSPNGVREEKHRRVGVAGMIAPIKLGSLFLWHFTPNPEQER